MPGDEKCSSVELLFLPRKLGGRGLLCIENLLERRLIMLSHHLHASEYSLVKMCFTLGAQLPSHVAIVSRAVSLVSSLGLNDILSHSCGQLLLFVLLHRRSCWIVCAQNHCMESFLIGFALWIWILTGVLDS